jgi:hypothetical protein
MDTSAGGHPSRRRATARLLRITAQFVSLNDATPALFIIIALG